MAPTAAFRLENAITILVALSLAGLSLFPVILGSRLNWLLGRGLIAVLRPLRKLQSGNVGDYVAWFVFGIAAYGALLILFL
jgi:hypothetical protein